VEGHRVVGTPDRAALVAVQTPQAFRVDLLRRALEGSDSDATDEAALVEALGVPVLTVAGDPKNLKITTPADLRVAAALLQA
jgi:2-C-methyl-D-erythritol 4-phosphate cytidylyltransferase